MTTMQIRHLRDFVTHRMPWAIRSDGRAARRHQLLGAAAVAHAQWRDECASVRSAYRRWAGSSLPQKPSAFHAYGAALDREEYAAACYARLIDSAGDSENEKPIVLEAKDRR
jgi:hypothetical protein